MRLLGTVILVLVMLFTIDIAHTLITKPTLQELKIKTLEMKLERLEATRGVINE